MKKTKFWVAVSALFLILSVSTVAYAEGEVTTPSIPIDPGDVTTYHTHTPAGAVEENRKEATCTQDGSYDKVIYCSSCNVELSRQTVPIRSQGHKYESSVTEPTCTEQGYTTYTCSACGVSYVDNYTNAKGHTEGEAVRENETGNSCTQPGSYDSVIYCTICKVQLSKEHFDVDALGHNYGKWEVIVPEVTPTCTQSGISAVEERKCIRCEYAQTKGGESLPASGHSYQAVVTKPTCTQQGYTTYTCSACSAFYVEDYTEPTGHSWGEWTVTAPAVEPTYTEKGSTAAESRSCSACDTVETRGGEEIPMLIKNKDKPELPPTDGTWEAEDVPFPVNPDNKDDGKNGGNSADDKNKDKNSGKSSGGNSSRTPASKTAVKRPKKTKIKKARKVKKKLFIKWKKIKGVSGYQIQYSTKKKNFSKAKTVTVKGAKKTKKRIKIKKANKKYYVRIRTFKGNGKNRVYSKWSAVKMVK